MTWLNRWVLIWCMCGLAAEVMAEDWPELTEESEFGEDSAVMEMDVSEINDTDDDYGIVEENDVPEQQARE